MLGSTVTGLGTTPRHWMRPNPMRVAFLVAMVVGTLLVPVVARASTATTTTLDVPSGTQYGTFTVTAHVRPAPQPAGGFLPAALIVIDGAGGGVPTGPLDSNGDGSTDLSLTPGSHTIVAKFGPFDVWDASESDPATVVVGTTTSTSVESSRNPALSTQSVTITANVAPTSITGGTLTITDAFDSSTLASGSVGPSGTTVSFTGTLAPGDHQLTATYSGHGTFGSSVAHLTQSIQADSGVDATPQLQYRTFYPFHDGYRDTNLIWGTLREPASVLIRIYSPTNALIRTVNLGSLPVGRYQFAWTGRNSAGRMLTAGTYRVVQRVTDSANNVKTISNLATISPKRLKWTSASATLYGNQFRGVADGGDGYVSASRSAYYRGVRLNSGHAGVAVNYKFSIHSAVVYSSTVSFRVLGRSGNGTQVYEGLFHHPFCSAYDLRCYDMKLMGPSYAWWSVSGDSKTHVTHATAWGDIVLPYEGRVLTFDVARVKFVYRWAVLV
jgi:FlgD Ig-like domain